MHWSEWLMFAIMAAIVVTVVIKAYLQGQYRHEFLSRRCQCDWQRCQHRRERQANRQWRPRVVERQRQPIKQLYDR